MPKKGHNEEQILRALRHAESGTTMREICREHGISGATVYIWKKKDAARGRGQGRAPAYDSDDHYVSLWH
jgi:putative transposase